jgi:hypothetical protein
MSKHSFSKKIVQIGLLFNITTATLFKNVYTEILIMSLDIINEVNEI